MLGKGGGKHGGAPPRFATEVNTFFLTKFTAGATSTSALWKTLAQAEPGFSSRFASGAFGSTTQLLQLMGRYAPQYRRTAAVDPGANAKGNGKGKSKGKEAGSAPNLAPAHAKAKGHGKSNNFVDLNIPPCFKGPYGAEVPYVAAAELQDGVCGVAQVAHGEADRLMQAYFDSQPFNLPCALLTTAGGAEELFATRKDLVERYSIAKIKVPVLRGNAAGSRSIDTLLIQMGNAASVVSFDDPTVMHVLAAADDTGLVRMNVVIRKSSVPDNTFDNLTKHCHQYVMEALGAGNFCPDHKVKPGPVRTTLDYRNKQDFFILSVRGF